jgi:hypothetical protein
MGLSRNEQAGIANILAHYEWRDYDYKYGRWGPEEKLWTFPGWSAKKWAETYLTFQLIDLASKEPVGELRALLGTLQKHSGRLRFAGDPAVAGVYAQAADGATPRLTVSTLVSTNSGLAAALVMRPGHVPATDPPRREAIVLDDRYPWIADHPEKPDKDYKPWLTPA